MLGVGARPAIRSDYARFRRCIGRQGGPHWRRGRAGCQRRQYQLGNTRTHGGSLHAAAANGRQIPSKSGRSSEHQCSRRGRRFTANTGDFCGHAACARVLIDADAAEHPVVQVLAAEIAEQKGLQIYWQRYATKTRHLWLDTRVEAGQTVSTSGQGDGRCPRLCIVLSRFISVRALLTLPFLPFVRRLSFRLPSQTWL